MEARKGSGKGPAAGAKRPATVTPPEPAASKRVAGKGASKTTAKLKLNVTCTADVDDIGMDTLAGTYVESGMNHGKKTFIREEGQDGLKIFLYYWDNRDGEDFSGWWFGDQVGGTQVWSRCEKAAALPPRTGWRIPWDGEVQKSLIIEQASIAPTAVSKAPKVKTEAKEELEDEETSSKPVADDRTQRATDQVVIAEIDASQALDSVRAMLEGEVEEESLQAVEDLLQAQLTAITEAHKRLASDIMEARKKAPKSVPILTKLTPRLRNVQASLTREMKEAKQLRSRTQQEAEQKQKEAKDKEQKQQAEQSDVKKLEDALPKAIDIVARAEETLDAVITAAGPLSVEAADETSEAVATALRDTEAAASKAQEAIQNARKEVAQQTKAAQHYAPGARKVAIAEFSSLQERLSQAGRKIAPYLRARKDYEQKLEAKKVLSEVTTKLGSVEAEVEKVVSKLGEPNKSEEMIKAAEASLMPVMKKLAGAMRFLDQSMQGAQGSLKTDLEQMQQRGLISKKKLEEFHLKLRGQSEQIQLQMMLRRAMERTEKAEELMQAASDAEAPFLKGDIEAVPCAEAEEAVTSCERCVQTADAAAKQAAGFLRAKLEDVKTYPEATRKAIMDELVQLQNRVEVVSQQVQVFKRTTAERQTTMLLHEVKAKVVDAESKVKLAMGAGAPLAEEKLEEVAVSTLKEAVERFLAAEKAAAISIVEAKKALATKQKSLDATTAPATYSAELALLQSRVGEAQQELAKRRKSALRGEKVWKGRQLLQDRQETLRQVAEEVQTAEILTTPLGDERPSEEKIVEMVAVVDQLEKKLAGAMKSLEAARGSAEGDYKTAIVKLLEQAARFKGRVDEMKATTRETREGAQCIKMIMECKEQLKKVESSFKKTEEAETPYLKGMDILPLEQASRAIADSEAAVRTVQQMISDARKILTAKSLELRSFLPEVMQRGLQEIGTLSKKNEDAVEELNQFKKRTDARKKDMLKEQAAVKVAEAEEAVQKTILAATPLATQNIDEITTELATELCEKLGRAEREANSKLDETRKFLMERQREARGDDAAVAKMTELQTRLNNAQIDLAKAKTTASEHEQKFVSKMLVHEANEMLKSSEAECAKALELAGPLTLDGGKSFVVAGLARILVDALTEHMTQKGITRDELFRQISKGDSKIGEAGFVSFVESLPELLSRPDLSFTSEQSVSIFNHALGSTTDNKVETMNSKMFAEFFRERYICTNGISVTDSFDMDSCKLVGKVEVDEILEAVQEPKSDVNAGITRVEVRLKDGSKGWVTLQGNAGTKYFETYSAYDSFTKRLEKTMDVARSSHVSAVDFVNEKCAELSDCRQGPLANARAELAKMRPKLTTLQTKLNQLQKDIDDGKKEHTKREAEERRQQEEKRERKASSLVLQAVVEKFEKAKSGFSKLQDVATPFVSLSESELGSYAKPVSIRKTVEELAGATTAAVSEARDVLKANEGKTARVTRGPWMEARQEMLRLKSRLDAMEKDTTGLVDQTRVVCESLAASKLQTVSAALRASVKTRGITGVDLYEELSGKSDYIPNAKFKDYLAGLPDLKLSPEQQSLLSQQGPNGPLGTDEGITRWGFLRMLQRFSKVVKEIAITKDFDIRTTPTLRKLEVAEIVEVLEPPQTDEPLGLTRVRARALADEAVGWITVKGNQGTPFLQDTPKPYFVAMEETLMQNDVASEGSAEIATLKIHEVLELLEGPRKQTAGAPMRAKGKSAQDGATGWFTISTGQGQDFAKPGQITYTCTAAIALTSDQDIATCQVLRKLDKGEVLTGLEVPSEDEKSGTVRVRAQAAKDNAQGWVTLKGNAGTVYAKETGRQYVITSKTPLQTEFKASSDQVKMLAEGEALEVIEGPKEEQSDPVFRMRARASSSGTVGWVTKRAKNLALWTGMYKCVAATSVEDNLAAEKAKVIRSLEPGEMLELLDGPKQTSGCLRLRVRVMKDGILGWVSVCNQEGKPLLQCRS